MTDERDTRTLLRRLCGELSPEEERRLEDRLAAEPELRAAADRLEGEWSGLEAPAGEAPAGFADEVMARVTAAEPEVPPWARLAAAAALVAGIALGAGIASVPPPEGLPEELAAPPLETLADSYLAALEELEREVGE